MARDDVGLLGALRGIRGPRVQRRLSDLPWPERVRELTRARWDEARATEPLEQTDPIVYTPESAVLWLERAQARHGRAVTAREVLEHVGFKDPAKGAVRDLSGVLAAAPDVTTSKIDKAHWRFSKS